MDDKVSEYVYADCRPDQGDDFSIPHRVIKKTKSRVYVSRVWVGAPAEEEAIVLDRAELENNGHAWHRRHGTFYTTPNYRLAN